MTVIKLPELPHSDANDTALALRALVFALGVCLPPTMSHQLADAMQACAGPDPASTSAGRLISAIAGGLRAGAKMPTPRH